ncbi:MAG: CDP-alcohol phosphatidyltransferase family protein [Acidimicrobiia bacterium]|nr:CDP-alcohol phosphatidyltransferase family protein [Acidimicrobiia bacterium]MBV9283316.1 CDP-alcohol phosphatidyltransferase family protein [Acidimicrobiia bacterium]
MTTEAGEDRVLTIPNVITVVRLLCVPVFLWLLFDQHKRVEAAVLLGVLGATDFADGYIARHLHQVSTLGKVLDPLADRVLLMVGASAILVDGSVPPFVAWATLVREVLVAGAFLVLAALGARRIDVQWAGKAGTFGLMFAFPFFLMGHDKGFSLHGPIEFLAWCCAIPALLLAWYAAVTYIPMARQALKTRQVDSTSA